MRADFMYKLLRAKEKLDGLYALCVTEQVSEHNAAVGLEAVVSALESAQITLRKEERDAAR